MPSQAFPEPNVDPEAYEPGFYLVYAAFLVPLPFLAIDLLRQSPAWFAPSGALALFLVAFAQQTQLSRLQLKHFRNAERASNHETIRGLSAIYQALEKRLFWAGLYATAAWAYGENLVSLLT